MSIIGETIDIQLNPNTDRHYFEAVWDADIMREHWPSTWIKAIEKGRGRAEIRMTYDSDMVSVDGLLWPKAFLEDQLKIGTIITATGRRIVKYLPKEMSIEEDVPF